MPSTLCVGVWVEQAGVQWGARGCGKRARVGVGWNSEGVCHIVSCCCRVEKGA